MPGESLIGPWPIRWLARTGSAPLINWRRLASGANCYGDGDSRRCEPPSCGTVPEHNGTLRRFA
jgi:hypothetical protein